MTAPILIACIGNPTAGDDGLGTRLCHALQSTVGDDAETVELGMNPTALIDLLEGRRVLFVVDAIVIKDDSPGRLVDCDLHDLRNITLAGDRSLSTHGISFSDQIALAERLQLLPVIARLFGLTLESAALETGLSPAVAKSVPKLLRRLLRRVLWARLTLARDCRAGA